LNSPVLVEVTLTAMLVAELTMEMATLGMAPPAVSLTTPEIVPRSNWASASVTVKRATRSSRMGVINITVQGRRSKGVAHLYHATRHSIKKK